VGTPAAGQAGRTDARELVGYGIGRAVGPRLRISRVGRFLGEHRWARAERYLAGRGAAALVPARFVAVLHAVAPLLAGMVRMPLRKFALWAGTGAVLWSVAYTSLGTAIGAAYREYRGLGLLITLVVIVLSAAVVFGRRLLRRRVGPDVDLEAPIPVEPAASTPAAGRGGG
jgi:membrane-associated protein